MAIVYPVQEDPTEIVAQGKFTRGELESILGGTFFYRRATKQVAINAWKPYGKIFVLREDSIMILPVNRTIKRHLNFFYWGPIIVLDVSELDDTLPWYLTDIIRDRGDVDT